MFYIKLLPFKVKVGILYTKSVRIVNDCLVGKELLLVGQMTQA
jgi:hypothetical protein